MHLIILKMESFPPETKAINFIQQQQIMFDKIFYRNLIANNFPQIKTAIAYGSGVFRQINNQNSDSNTTDFLFIVNNQRKFHQQNFKRNRNHYSGLSYLLGQRFVNTLNVSLFPIHFNPNKIIENKKIKYGVLSQKVLQQDLKNWNIMTIAGRLHKPVEIINFNANSNQLQNFKVLYERNLIRAVCIALLLLDKKKISKLQFYYKICQLSYKGDIRMQFEIENPKKVQNIVNGNYEMIDNLYKGVIKKQFYKWIKSNNESYQVRANQQLLLKISQNIPKQIADKILKNNKKDFKDFFLQNQIQVKNRFQFELSLKNYKNSKNMAIYHGFTTSPITNIMYGLEKLYKKKNK